MLTTLRASLWYFLFALNYFLIHLCTTIASPFFLEVGLNKRRIKTAPVVGIVTFITKDKFFIIFSRFASLADLRVDDLSAFTTLSGNRILLRDGLFSDFLVFLLGLFLWIHQYNSSKGGNKNESPAAIATISLNIMFDDFRIYKYH